MKLNQGLDFQAPEASHKHGLSDTGIEKVTVVVLSDFVSDVVSVLVNVVNLFSMKQRSLNVGLKTNKFENTPLRPAVFHMMHYVFPLWFEFSLCSCALLLLGSYVLDLILASSWLHIGRSCKNGLIVVGFPWVPFLPPVWWLLL